MFKNKIFFIQSLLVCVLMSSVVCLGAGSGEFDSVWTKESFRYDAGKKGDPFISIFEREGKKIKVLQTSKDKELKKRLSIIVVNGILWEEDTPLAMINSKIYKTGDTVEELDITFIDDNNVTLSYQGLEETISIIKRYEWDAQGGTNENDQ